MCGRRMWWASSMRRAVAAGFLTAWTLTAVQLWPSLGRGQILYRDFVQVPDPVLGSAALGLDGRAPRAVPLDAVTASLAPLVPTGVQQQVMLWACLAAAGCGLAVLLRRHGSAATASAAAVATWNPYAAERLLVGQPPTLLGWAMVPWVVVAVRSGLPPRRRVAAVALAAAPAALTPWGGLVTVLAVAVAWWTVRRGRTRREGVALLILAAAWCSPWVLAGLVGASGVGERAGAAAFAVQVSGARSVLDVVTGGGIWADGATLASRSGLSAIVASGLLLAAAGAALTRRDVGQRRLLAVAVLAPPLLALVLAGPGEGAWAAAQDLPGVGIGRDVHRLLGLSTLAGALLVGLAAEKVARAAGGLRPVAGLASMVALASLTVLSAPDAPARLHEAYHPVEYPRGVLEAVGAVGGRTTLVLPWQPLRRQDWVGPAPFLDPLPLALAGHTLVSRELSVLRDGKTLVVGADPAGARAAAAWGAGDIRELRALGIEAVVQWRGTPGASESTPAAAAVREVGTPGPFRVWLLTTR